MKNRKKIKIVLILIIISATSCIRTHTKPIIESFSIDIPKNEKNIIDDVRDRLKLIPLEKGFDSLQIRIWLIESLSSKQQVVVIFYQKKEWQSYLINFEPIYYDNSKFDSVLFINKTVSAKAPISSWEDFMKKIYENKVLTLQDQSKIINYDHPFDGGSVTVEVASKNYYRIYSYHEPQNNLDIKEAELIENILKIIKEELVIDLIKL